MFLIDADGILKYIEKEQVENDQCTEWRIGYHDGLADLSEYVKLAEKSISFGDVVPTERFAETVADSVVRRIREIDYRRNQIRNEQNDSDEFTATKTWHEAMRKANSDNDFALEFIDCAVKVSKKAETYRWHSLRKDPNDLPLLDTYVLVFEQFVDGSIRFFATTFGCGFNPVTNREERDVKRWRLPQYHRQKDVIAWKYIEPFEEGNNEPD